MESGDNLKDNLKNTEPAKISGSEIELRIDDFNLNPGKQFEKLEEFQEEVIEDLTHLVEKVSEVDKLVKSFSARLDKIEETNSSNYSKHQKELDGIKSELLGDKKTLVYKSVFNNIVVTIDSLYTRKNNLSIENDSALYSLTVSILDNLQNLLKTFGFEYFIVQEKELFSPESMECLGFEKGEENKVIRIERLGYRSNNQVIRACGVILGKS